MYKKSWEEKLYTDFGINRPIKNFSEDYPLNFLEEANADYISNIIAGFEENPEQLDLLLNQFTEMYSDSIAKMLEAYCKSRNKTIENLIEDDILEFSDMVSGPLFDAFMHVLMVSQSVDSVFDASRENPTSEDFSSVSNNWDRANFDVFWTHCKTKLGAPLSLDQLMEEDYEAYERAVSFFENDSDGEIQYEELRAAFLDTLNSVDREIYELREQKYTESDIAYKLHYKTHSAVSKRIKVIGEKLKEFIAKRE